VPTPTRCHCPWPIAAHEQEHPMSEQAPIQHVGYIGIGIMGRAMAANLLKAGFGVTVWNRTPRKCDPLKEQGAAVAESPADLASRGPDAICINVSDTPDVEQVLFGDAGVCAGAKDGLVVIDHSTISPDATRDFAERLAKQRVALVDAPVSGGDVGAQKGTLSIMVGSPSGEVFDRCLPLFQAMGKSITHVGPTGMGQVCKACNQIAVSCNLIGVCEALALARKSGLDLDKMIGVVSGGAAGSWQLANLGPKIAAGDHAPGFMIDLVLKDLAIVADAARRLHLPLNATALAEGYFRAVKADDGGKLGTQAMARTLEKLGSFGFAG
jgi:3-hydroxyisobutyrate dehydrogenase-like beta-hydroxyacid dehydrogenase